MTRCKCACGGCVLAEGERIEVGRRAELVVAAVITIVHKDPSLAIEQLEHPSTLHGFVGLLKCPRSVAPHTREACCRDLADTALAFVLVESVVELVFGVVDDVHVNSGRAAVVHPYGFALEAGEVTIGIGSIHLVVADGTVVGEQREVNHILTCLRVPDGFRGPDAGDIGE